MIVLNIPHNSNILPYNSWEGDIEKYINRWTDWHTKEIFSADGIPSVVAKFSRFYVDTERLINDPLESIGQGRFYTNFEECHRTISSEEREEMESYYQEHINTLRSTLHEGDLLIDCHSFPSDLSDVDVCIGYNEDWSKPEQEVIDVITNAFKGYKIGINEPYSNSISPVCDFKYQSVMIELNKRIYSDGIKHLNSIMRNIYSSLFALQSLQ